VIAAFIMKFKSLIKASFIFVYPLPHHTRRAGTELSLFKTLSLKILSGFDHRDDPVVDRGCIIIAKRKTLHLLLLPLSFLF
jgi:hypothetical protein